MRSRCRSDLPTLLQVLLLGAVLAACEDSDPVAPPADPGEDPPTQAEESSELIAIHLGTLGGDSTQALDVNDHGQVVGWSHDDGGVKRPFIWSAEEGMRDLGTLDGPEGVAMGLNEHGTVVGWTGDAEGDMLAVRWESNEEPEALALHPYGDPSGHQAAVAINKAGEIVGWSHGEFLARWGPDGTALGMPKCPTGYPADINEDGMIVGIAFGVVGATLDGRAYSGFVWSSEEGGCRERLLIDDDFVATDVMAVNDPGEIVGLGGAYEELDPPQPGMLHLVTSDEPFTWADEMGFQVDHKLPAHPTDINNQGTIVGDGIEAINNLGDRVGGAYLWTTQPERFGSSHAGAHAPQPFVSGLASPVAGQESASCPRPLMRLVELGAVPECPPFIGTHGSR